MAEAFNRLIESPGGPVVAADVQVGRPFSLCYVGDPYGCADEGVVTNSMQGWEPEVTAVVAYFYGGVDFDNSIRQ